MEPQACVSLLASREEETSCGFMLRTNKSSQQRGEEQFFNDLDDMLCLIPEEDMYVILGDFNARVGSREETSEEWRRVRGPHGYGTANDAGKEVLAYLAAHQATVCNTWFRKKKIHLATWQHLRSKEWCCIDYIVKRQ